MAVHVDDLVIAARTEEIIRATINDLKTHFQVKALGATQWLLGIAVHRNKEARTTLIHQHKYILDMVDRFGQRDAAAINLPYARGDERQPKEVSPCGTKEISLYISSVGSLLYAAVATRPDIT
jgi:hypothetical protein